MTKDRTINVPISGVATVTQSGKIVAVQLNIQIVANLKKHPGPKPTPKDDYPNG